ncbi:MAG TPA: class I SAM-dependent methyltransferase [Anaerolineales bacterium]|nr:class I SAM-dependent methyltransferase [Anaerolineae bacterium]HIP87877.1 class I SAM-dependent methyltransferase [Anaerolineales bacterium]
MAWWETVFDDRYLRLWGPLASPEATEQQVEGIIAYLGVEPGASILDLACGYGRIAIPLAQRGFRVTGLDLSETLLGQARANAAQAGVEVDWHQGDMREIPWEGAFDAVINVFSSFGYFTDEEENRRVLEGVARAIKPGGRFLIDVINRDWQVRQDLQRRWFEAGDLLVLEDPWLDPVEGRAGEVWRWLEGGRWQTLEFDVRIYTATELKALIEAAGLRWITVYGGWTGDEFGPQSRRIIALAEKPG